MSLKLTSKRPWNRVDLPVYAVSSNGTKPNMHICTYVSAVSMQPKRIMVALYEGTQTLANVELDKHFVLQLLAPSQYLLVNVLGKQSGKNIDKISRLQKRQLIDEWEGFSILKEALAVMHLQVVNDMEGGDHHLFVCDVIAYKNLNNGNALTTSILNEKGIIRI
ncbi:flavin reductase family protein [Ferruginibacter yonginensis]|uniref:Flavin reductase family protein n=1 Tax=Ferruginibacter yonginensis TaxID=1310416 RepID=A0ABV8QMG9_9BACT